MRKSLVVAAVVAAVLVTTTGASSAPQVNLAIVPLPKSALGAAARAFPVATDSGVVSNADAANDAAATVTPGRLSHLGRLTGYLLDYGNPFSSGPGITEIETQIDRYRNVADARNGLEFWRRDELKTPALKRFGIDFSLKKLSLAGLPGPSWEYGGTAALKGLKPLHGVDAAFQRGQYVLSVSIAGGSISAAARLVPGVARKLDHRMRLALAGRLDARPVKLPPPREPGPPPHGPKPADMVLTKSDVGTPATIRHGGYSRPGNALDQNAVSAYDLTMAPAGSYPYISQEVLVGANHAEMQYFAAIAMGAAAAGPSKVKSTPVDLGGIGDGARGEILRLTANGRTAYEAVVVLSHGSYLGFSLAATATPLTATKVRSFAHLTASRFDAGLAG